MVQSQKFHKNFNWNVKEIFLTYIQIIWLHLIEQNCYIEKIFTLHSVEVLSTPNLPPLFVIVFWGKTNRSSLSQMFFKIDVLKNFANFVGKHHCWSIFLIKLQPLWWLLLNKPRLFCGLWISHVSDSLCLYKY